MKSSHQVKLEEGLAPRPEQEFDAKADGIRAGADATIESMAAEVLPHPARLQEDAHRPARGGRDASRNELAAAQLAMRDMAGRGEERAAGGQRRAC